MYAFTGLAPGSYGINEALKTGWAQTVPVSGVYTETMTSGLNIEDRIFGNYQYSTISGDVYHDVNSNGVRDIGEPGLGNWKVRLTGGKTDSVLTLASGSYTFTSVPPGNFTITEVTQVGYILTAPESGYQEATVTSGQTITDKSFANYKFGAIAGVVYRDRNGNGIRDVGETPLENWKISITGPRVDSVLSDANGNYIFLFLYAGTYTVGEELLENWYESYPQSGTYSVAITSGVNAFAKDFGNYELSTARGIVFNDLNGNGTRDNGESGVENWKIRIAGSKDDSTLSDINGNYIFQKISAGSFTITQDVQSDWVQTKPSSFGSYNFTVVSEQLTGLDFGSYHYSSIGGLVFEDFNGNGIKDVGDNGVGSWKVKLSGGVIDSMLTDNSGTYLFDSLPPGNFTLKQELQTGWGRSFPEIGRAHV